jgi:hypothetical protein
MPLSAIFFDLDHTLIHSTEQEAEAQPSTPPQAKYGPWMLWRRPVALDLLAAARRTRRPVYLCTLANHHYALGLSQALGLGFGLGEILALEHLRMGRRDLAPLGVLMDDRPADYDGILWKRQVLGLSADRVFHVSPFEGQDMEPEDLLLQRWRIFLQARIMSR